MKHRWRQSFNTPTLYLWESIDGAVKANFKGWESSGTEDFYRWDLSAI